MPTYEYVCKKCGEHIEVFQSFQDKPLKLHKECGGDLQKRFHASGIVFKGSGFYATDSKTTTSTKSSPSTEKAASTEKKPESSSDSKPKAQAASKSSKDD
jgi:putative FmdB family regulatory protein